MHFIDAFTALMVTPSRDSRIPCGVEGEDLLGILEAKHGSPERTLFWEREASLDKSRTSLERVQRGNSTVHGATI